MARSLTVETLDEFPDGRTAEAWDDLVTSDPAGTLFHSGRFLRQWCRHLRGKCDLKLRVLRDGDEVVGVVPEVREREGDFAGTAPVADGDVPVGGRELGHFAGGYHVTDYLGPVSRPDVREGVVAAWLDTLAGEDDWDAFVAGGLAADAGWHELIADRAARLGLAVSAPEVEDVCPRIDIGGGWEAYLERISGKQRHEIRRKARKLARETDTVKLVTVDPEDVARAIDDFIELAQTADGDKGSFFDDEAKAAFFHGLAAEFGPDETLRVHRLDLDGAPAAYTVSFVYGREDVREWGLYNSAFARDLGALAPGMVLVGELIRIAAEDGCAVFDLLRGGEAYKYRFGATDRHIHRLVLSRGTGEAEG